MKLVWTSIFLTVLSWATSVRGQSYVVQSGDTLSTIAANHGVDPDELARLNKVTDPDHVEVGQTLELPSAEGRVVSKGVMHIVKRGVTLRRIAAAYEFPFHRLVRANRIRNPDLIRRGREIFIPGAKRVVPIATKHVPPCLNDPVEFYRIRTGESKNVVLTQCDGSIWEEGQIEISDFLDRTKNQSAPALNARLLQMIQKVANRWPGRRIEVVSAYRPPVGETRATSRHAHAKALDFRVAGIRNTQLRDFARTLGNVGVGYYPNSTFVHLDVRERRGFWVDWSGPGEPARYGTLDHDPAGDLALSGRSRHHLRRHTPSRRRVRRRATPRSGRGGAAPASNPDSAGAP